MAHHFSALLGKPDSKVQPLVPYYLFFARMGAHMWIRATSFRDRFTGGKKKK
jgi:hypothetical protein